MIWQVWRPTNVCEIPLLYKNTRNTQNTCSTFLKPTTLDKHCFYGLFMLLRCFGKFGDPPNIVKSRFYTRKLVIHITLVLSTFLKLTKFNIQCFYGLFKILGGFDKFGGLPNFLKSCLYTTKLVKTIPLVLHF